MEEHKSAYLNPNRLADVIAALQFLGRYTDYKRSIETWERKMSTTPSISATSWGEIFRQHPEFFRINKDGKASLLWRRAVEHERDDSGEKGRPPLDDQTILKLIDVAVLLNKNAAESEEELARKEREKQRNQIEGNRWKIQLGVQVLTALLALAAALLAAWIKVSG